MTPATTFAGRRVALFGLGGSGLATVRALLAGGAEVVAWDDGEDGLAKARAQGIATVDLREIDWSLFAALVLAPGVPLTHPEPHWTVALARKAGLEIIGDIELFCRERAKLAPRAPFVAITGTNGKSTTTALVAHILREAGRDVQMGGNIGVPVLALAPPANDRVHVVEMSSFQIDLTPSFNSSPIPPGHHAEEPAQQASQSTHDDGESASRRARPLRWAGAPQHDAGGGIGADRIGSGPTVGVLLNVTPDHLDRHGTFAAYSAIKERLVAASGLAVICIDDAPSREIIGRLAAARAEPLTVTGGRGLRHEPRPHLCVEGARIVRTRLHPAQSEERITVQYPLGEVVDLTRAGTLRGRHNAQNACAASAVASALGLDDATIARGMASFPGLAHRMEEVGRVDRVLFVNDSKATNADSAEKALLSFGRVHWILGGVAKAGGIEPLQPLFTRVVKAYLIGEATEAFAASLGDAVPFSRCVTLERAVAEAAADAARSDAEEPVVLLSPACASYDQYPNFERRGDHFRMLVRALPGGALPNQDLPGAALPSAGTPGTATGG